MSGARSGYVIPYFGFVDEGEYDLIHLIILTLLILTVLYLYVNCNHPVTISAAEHSSFVESRSVVAVELHVVVSAVVSGFICQWHDSASCLRRRVDISALIPRRACNVDIVSISQ